MVGRKLIGGHNLPPLVGIEMYRQKQVKTNPHVPTCSGVPANLY